MNANKDLPPQLPQGNSSVWQGISENFTFHSSPELFIAKRVTQWRQSNPGAFEARAVVRAKILNRNVAIVSSYAHIRAILDVGEGVSKREPQCVAGAAYNDLMGQFFPGPNLLLADGPCHQEMRHDWDGKMAGSREKHSARLSGIVDDFLSGLRVGTPLDLYEHMKSFAWRVLLGLFLDLHPDNSVFAELQKLQEDLLRGQFSLMPVSINTGFWQSPRKRGIEARKSLQSLILQRLKATGTTLSFGSKDDEELVHIADHVLMMTSSLAAKALASLSTAYLMNLFLFDNGTDFLYHKVNQSPDPGGKHRLLRSIYLETERLSPPIVGIMRRLTTDIVLRGGNDEKATLLPSGWDAWLYFVGATRDKSAFGETSEQFDPYRYLSDQVPPPLGFGAGQKICLGQSLMQEITITLAEQMMSRNMSIRGEVLTPGLKGWLGWATSDPESWATDVKQLPTQHPVVPVLVHMDVQDID